MGQLQDKGNSATVKSYLESLEGAYLIKLLYKYSTRALSVKSSSPKLIPLCPALMSAFTNPDKMRTDAAWRGKITEAVVGAHLHLLFRDKVSYWREGNDEVDFVIEHDDRLFAIEVTAAKAGSHSKKSLISFKKKFADSSAVMMGKESLEKFLSMNDSSEAAGFLAKIGVLLD